MDFSSIIFVFMFLPLFLICYFIPKKIKIKNIVLLIFSLFFYAWGEPYYIFLMLFMIIINYFLVIKMDEKKSRKILVSLIIINLLSLFSFKYLNFVIDNINGLFNLNINNINLSLPIGISFYTFQILSYVIDVYNGKVKVQKSFINLACYVSAFPQLIAGPIVRYADIEKELLERKTTIDDFYIGIKRFIIGLSKKVLIANNVSFICDSIFNYGIESSGFVGIVIAVISYTLQIYFDFSGYSDMAIGLGRMFGFHFLENFNYPYLASSITDFWRRWHISLSSWFRDYVYFSLGGSRVDSKARHIFNLFIVWLLTGIWHGANWTFITWGLFYFVLLVIEKQTGLDKKKAWWGHIYTMFFVILAWVLFRSNSIYDAFSYIFVMFGYTQSLNQKLLPLCGYLLLLFSFFCSIPFWENIYNKLIKIHSFNVIFPFIRFVYLIILFLLEIVFMSASSYNPFIYFNF